MTAGCGVDFVGPCTQLQGWEPCPQGHGSHNSVHACSGSFSNRDVGIKVPPPCLLVQVPVAQTCHFLFFQADMLNDPEFSKNVKGLERMLRVRESACLGLAGSDSSGSRVVAGCESHAVSTVSESQRGGWTTLLRLESGGRENDAAITVSALQRGALWFSGASGGANSAEDAVLETSGRENDAVFTVSESRGLPDIAEDAVLETCVRENDPVLTVSESSPSVKAGENLDCLR